MLAQLSSKKNIKAYGMIIEENIGSKDGGSLELLIEGVLYNLATGMDIKIEDIVVLDSYPAKFQKQNAENLVAFIDYKGLTLIYSYTIVLGPSYNWQLVTYFIAKEFNRELEELHESFVELTNIDVL